MTNEARAKAIAEQANKCCTRSDGYEEAIYALALEHLQAAYRAGYAAADNNPRQPESMGR